MKYKLVKLSQLSGNKASIYSIILNNEEITLLDKFISENIILFKSETNSILMRLISIGSQTGAREQFFKIDEGKPGDGICALYDSPKSNLRLYCIKYGSQLIVVGGGGHKPKSIKAFQEDENLKNENYFLRQISDDITERIISKEIRFINDNCDFSGNLEFEDNEDE